VLGPELLAVLQDAFQAQHGLCLPTSMTQGVIPLLYKGKGSKAMLDSYRPITLLNSDYKLLAKALATRFGPALQHVADPTQTAFVPGRWIGGNVLCHLEEMEYLQQTGQPGCMDFLDFSTAYDRLSRPWVLDCMSNTGFGERACKWVSIMLENTSATAAFNGWQSSSFPERSGIQQGSPLSPLLNVLAPNLWPVTSGTKPTKVSSGQSPCQVVSQRLSTTNRLMTPPCMCFSPQMLRRLSTAA